MARLGSCDNVTVKLSGGFATDAHWTQSSAVELVKETVKLFTPRRYYHIVCGSVLIWRSFNLAY